MNNLIKLWLMADESKKNPININFSTVLKKQTTPGFIPFCRVTSLLNNCFVTDQNLLRGLPKKEDNGDF